MITRSRNCNWNPRRGHWNCVDKSWSSVRLRMKLIGRCCQRRLKSSLQLASLEQQKADENVCKLAEEQKRQLEELPNHIIRLEQQLDAKQALEMEIEQLRGTVNVMKLMEDDDDAEVLQNIEGMLRDLREKEEEYDHLQDLSQSLIIKERKNNEEVQEARKELISALKNLASDSGRTTIGVRGGWENLTLSHLLKQ